MELEPLCSAEPLTCTVQLPPLSAQLPSAVDPAARKLTEPLAAGVVPVVTVAVSVVDWLDVIVVGAAVSVVLLVRVVVVAFQL